MPTIQEHERLAVEYQRYAASAAQRATHYRARHAAATTSGGRARALASVTLYALAAAGWHELADESRQLAMNMKGE